MTMVGCLLLAAEKEGEATLSVTASGLPVANVKIAVETAESPEPPSREEISLDRESLARRRRWAGVRRRGGSDARSIADP